jgi:hypothetical protein
VLEVFPGFGYFPDPIWPIEAFVYTVLKGSKEKAKRLEEQASAESQPESPRGVAARREARREAARNAALRRVAARQLAQVETSSATPADDNNPVELLVKDLSMTSIRAGKCFFLFWYSTNVVSYCFR